MYMEWRETAYWLITVIVAVISHKLLVELAWRSVANPTALIWYVAAILTGITWPLVLPGVLVLCLVAAVRGIRKSRR